LEKKRMTTTLLILLTCVLPLAGSSAESPTDPQQQAQQILASSGVQGGLIVHLGCGDGRLTAALRASDSYLVHGLDADPLRVATARHSLIEQGQYGGVTIDQLFDSRLPYIDNLVNLIVVENPSPVTREELLRVLCPGGVAILLTEQGMLRAQRLVKPRPAEIDEWTHYLHSPSNNAVSRDTVVGPPRRLQWVGSPLYSRHHDRMSSVSAVVSAGGRVFSIFDEATPISILAPPEWSLIARDAFNGTILWRRPIERWHPHLWPLKSGPAQLPRRLVASDQTVYVTLSLNGPLLALDAATGQTVREYEGTAATEEILLDDGTLFLRVDLRAAEPEAGDLPSFSRAAKEPFYDDHPRQLMAIDAQTGQVLWRLTQPVLPGTLTVGADAVFYHDGQSVVSLNRATGQPLWRSEPVERQRGMVSRFMPTLVAYEDVLLFAGASGRGRLTALSAESGEVLWQGDHPPSGYQSPEDVLVAGGLVWCGETTVGSGIFTGRDPRTGEVKAEFPPDTDVFWFHHRCYRGRATENYLLMSRTGVEFIDFRDQSWMPHHWVRGACLYGIMPANGLLYAPQHPCACYLEAKLSGFNALAPAMDGPRVPDDLAVQPRWQPGPAWEDAAHLDAPQSCEHGWPTYRGDRRRSGRTLATVPTQLQQRWQADLGGRLTAPVISGGRVLVARVDTHTVYALDAVSGQIQWSFTAGGAVDSPPTIDGGRALFGAADGYVYCLRVRDGQLVWRFRAAPMDQRLMALEQLQSVWPVHGSVLVLDKTVWCVAGRSVFLDGGLRLIRLDATTGRLIGETVLDDRDPVTGDEFHEYVSWLNMPVGLPDILSSDGRYVYMRSQAFELDGTPKPLEVFPRTGEGHGGQSFAPPPDQDPHYAHLFSPTGFLDDTWWHRTYWLYGSRFYSGWSAYYLSGRVVPAGRILVFDDDLVYGFGRKPQYFRWTTPIEHHLFAAEKTMPEPMSELPPLAGRRSAAVADDAISRVQVPKTDELNPTGKPLTIEAWIHADRPGGVVLAQGGHSHGYSLYLEQGRPHFTVRAKDLTATVAADARVVGRWCHLAAVLMENKQLELYIDGKLAAIGTTPTLMVSHPLESIDIGADSQTWVVAYQGGMQFQGRIDEVRLYHRALSAAELADRAAGRTLADPNVGLVLAYDFADGKAADRSGHEHHGTIQRATLVDGRSGRSLSFVESSPGAGAARALVQHRWSTDLPLLPRALVLAGDVLFMAGPPDMVDEEQAGKTLASPATQAALIEYAEALEGRRGGLLWAVSKSDGQALTEQPLAAPPIFDGMAAAQGNLFLVTVDGQVVCFGQTYDREP
jgi:outer membrane protein assembly factor BamB